MAKKIFLRKSYSDDIFHEEDSVNIIPEPTNREEESRQLHQALEASMEGVFEGEPGVSIIQPWITRRPYNEGLKRFARDESEQPRKRARDNISSAKDLHLAPSLHRQVLSSLSDESDDDLPDIISTTTRREETKKRRDKIGPNEQSQRYAKLKRNEDNCALIDLTEVPGCKQENESIVISSDSDPECWPTINSASRCPTGRIEKGALSTTDEESESVDMVFERAFFKDQSEIPFFPGQEGSILTTEALERILNAGHQDIATRVPSAISSNALFLISASAIGHYKNIYSDGMGAWRNNGKKKTFLFSHEGKTEVINERKFGDPNTFLISRTTYINKSDESVRKTVILVQKFDSSMVDTMLIQYRFTDGNRHINPLPHGNSKSKVKTPYCRTQESTKIAIGTVKEKGPTACKDTYNQVLSQMGGVMGLKDSGQAPRNLDQINYIRKKSRPSATDDVQMLMDKFKNSPRENFIYELTHEPELCVFVCNRQQLNELECFCTNPTKFCILGVDATFNIGKYYVTFTVYRNLKLHNSNKIHPIMMGPVLIHHRKLYSSYYELPFKIVKYNEKLEGLLAYGTDGEQNLQNAFSRNFPNAFHLLCDIHMKDNIKSKLTQLQIPSGVSNIYINDIFGHVIGSEKEPGLVDCLCPNDFDENLQKLEATWVHRHHMGRRFLKYFREEKAPLIKGHMTADVRAMCGLGFPPISYNQNASEALNSTFKRGLHKQLSIHECVEKIELFITLQQEQTRMALLGMGEWRPTEDFQRFSVPQERFFLMGDGSKKAVIKRFIDEPMPFHDTHEMTSSITIQEPGVRLSIQPEESGIISVPFAMLRDMFSKAARLLSKSRSLVEAPGQSNFNHFMVASTSTPDQPHSVRYPHNKVNISCDGRCFHFQTYKLCSHVLCVADYCSILKEFLQWYCSMRVIPKLTNMSVYNLPTSRGKKATKSTSKRKGPPYKACTPPVTYTEGTGVCDTATVPVPPIPTVHAAIAPPSRPNPDPGVYMLTLFSYCHPQVSKCYGCGGPLQKLEAPNDMIVVTKTNRKYFDQTKRQMVAGKLSNVYFHMNQECIRKSNTFFMPGFLIVPTDLKPFLKDVHRGVLSSADVPGF